jgi:tRNA A-37 threonylcarbamoyl transferase component Bud32
MHTRNFETMSYSLTCVRRGDFVVFHDSSEVYAEVVANLLADPDRLFAAGQPIQSPWQSAATDKTVVKIGGRSYFFKRYNCLGGGYRLKNLFRNSRALKSWWAGWKFLELGLPTPRPIACLEERRLRLLGRSYLLFELIDGAQSLLDRWAGLSAEGRRDVLSLLGSEIGNMHRRGLLHGDLNWRNVLVREISRSLEVYFVDLDGCSDAGGVNREQAEKDMSHFFRDMQRNQATGEETALFMASWENAFRLR